MKLSAHDIERFWAFVDKRGPDECWFWRGYCKPKGYGEFRLGKRAQHAHRISFLIAYGYLKECVLHKCDTPRCVNPTHLWCGTNRENSKDCVTKGRTAAGARNGRGGAKLTEIQVRAIIAAAAGGKTKTSLAKKYNVSRWAIQDIVSGRSWGWSTGIMVTQ